MKFAYMIMAHNEPYILERLLNMLDYPENDLYLHVDAKSTCIDKSRLRTSAATLRVIESQNVAWGGYSIIRTELALLAEAAKTEHDYYHLISGVDLPLKTQADMIQFFTENYGKEFIGIIPEWTKEASVSERYKLHWYFQDKIGKSKNGLFVLSRLVTKLEQAFHYRREKRETVVFYGGPNWFSITQDCAKLILESADWIERRFQNTTCCDEIFAQTVVGNSPLAGNIYRVESGDAYAECLRYLRFGKNSPFVLEMKDCDSIIGSGCLFARKFGTATEEQKKLVDAIAEKYQ